MGRVKGCAQDRAIANTMVCGAFECLDRCARTLNTEGRVATGLDTAAGVEDVLAQHDVLTRNILLIRSAAVVLADHAAVGRGTLRPVDPVVFERKLFGGMVACRQLRDERRDLASVGVDDHDT